jgi:hypothetical protein
MTIGATRLARAVKIYVNIGWWISAIGLVVVPIAYLLVLGAISQPDRQAPDLPVLARIYMDQEALAGTTPGVEPEPSALVFGQGEMRIRTRSKAAWTLVMGLAEMVLLVVLYVFGQLRAVLRTVVDRRPFMPENAERIRKVGLVTVAWSLVVPFLKLFTGVAVLDEVAVEGLILKPPFEFSFEILFFGLAIIVLAEVFRQASVLQHQQSLTV